MRRIARWSWPVASALLIACAPGDTGAPGTGAAVAVLSTQHAHAAIARGDSSFTTVTVTRGAGSSSPVILSAEAVPAGVTVSFLPKRLEPGVTTSIVTFMVDANAAVTSTPIVIRAAGDDASAATATVVVAVSPPSLALATGAGTVSAIKGGPTTSASLYLARVSAAYGVVQFVADSVPAGVTATFVAATIGDRATQNSLLLTATGNAAVGTHTVRVRASMPGVNDALLRIPFTVVAPGDRGFDLAALTPTLVVQAGASITTNIAVQRYGDFTGAVDLTVEGAQFGVTGGSARNAHDTVPSPLTLVTTPQLLAGDYTLLVRGRATGLADRTVPLRLSVRAGFSLAATSVTLPRGSVGSSSFGVLRSNGYTGPVTLSVVKLPAYLSAYFNPNIATGVPSSLIITAAQNAPAGPAMVEVRGIGPNALDQTLVVNVVIPP